MGDEERAAREATEPVARRLRDQLLMIPNLPSPEAPDGADENDNVEMRRWWPGMDEGRPEPRTPITSAFRTGRSGAELGILDLEAGARIAGSMFPLFRGDGSRLLRALSAFSLDRHGGDYEEIRPPTFALDRDDDVDRTPAQVGRRHVRHRTRRALGDTHGRGAAHLDARGEILDEARLPIRLLR